MVLTAVLSIHFHELFTSINSKFIYSINLYFILTSGIVLRAVNGADTAYVELTKHKIMVVI